MTTNSQTALITGGTSGIGRAAANKLAQLGIHVIVVGRNAERGENTVAEIRAAGGGADFISSDLHDASSTRDVARQAIELGNGHVDILINNAGIFPFGPTHETTEDMFWVKSMQYIPSSMIFFAYWVILEYKTGQTIGKKVLNLKVTDMSGNKPNLKGIILSSFGKAFLLPIDVVLGMILTNEKRQRIFNKLGDTLVVKIKSNSETQDAEYTKD